MKAIVVKEFGDANVCQLVKDVPIPNIQSDEVLIRVYAAGVNPADTYIRSGNYYRLPNLPYTPGFDAAGVIERIGDGVTKFKPGDRVFTTSTLSGSYAEYCTARSKFVYHLASNLSFEEGSALGVPYFTAYRALFIKGHAKPNETVLIHGASGGVGIPAVQLAKAHGMFVIGTASTEEGLQLVRDQGADLVFNHKNEGYMNEIVNATKDRDGIDLVLEMLANVNLNNDLHLLKPRSGRVVVVGNRGTIDINPRLMMIKETAVCGVILSQSTDDEYQMMAAHLQSSFKLGYLKPLLGRIYSLEEAAQAHTDIIHGTGAHGRITIKIRE